MATVLSGVLLTVATRLFTIIAASTSGGLTLSATGQVQYGDFDRPPLDGPFVAIGYPEMSAEYRSETPLDVLTTTATFPIEGWALSPGDTPTARLAAAPSLLGQLLKAIKDDYATAAASPALFALLSALPRFEDIRMHGPSTRAGAVHARVSFALVVEFRSTNLV